MEKHQRNEGSIYRGREMSTSFYGTFFLFCRSLARFFVPRYTVEVPEIDQPSVFIAHHQNLFGPFITMLWFSSKVHTWMLHSFLDPKECYDHYVNYTFTKRFGLPRPIAKMIAYPFSFGVAKLMKSGRGLPVYRGSKKIRKTFQLSIESLRRGENIIIFPDVDYQDDSSEIKEMYSGFLHLEKYYYQATGKHLSFVPLYVSKGSRQIIAGKPIFFPGQEDFRTEREMILSKIQENLNVLAQKYEIS